MLIINEYLLHNTKVKEKSIIKNDVADVTDLTNYALSIIDLRCGGHHCLGFNKANICHDSGSISSSITGQNVIWHDTIFHSSIF